MNDFNFIPSQVNYRNPQVELTGQPTNLWAKVFGPGRDWSDSEAYAAEVLAQREANAFNTAVMNYQNKYNSPLEQMKRYQEAGINPYQQGAVQNVSSAGAQAAGVPRASSSKAQRVASELNAIANVVGTGFSIVSSVAGIAKQIQQMKYNKEAFPLMLNRLRYQSDNENLRGFLTELGINQNTLDLVSTAYSLGIPLDSIPWMTYGPNVKGTSIGFDWGKTSKWTKEIENSPYGKNLQSILGLRGSEMLNKAVQRAKLLEEIANIHQRTETEKENTRKTGAQADIAEWSRNAVDITGNETLDKILFMILQSVMK